MHTPVLTYSMVLALWGVVWAQEPCFCMRDGDDNWLRGCQERLAPVTRQPELFCQATPVVAPTKVLSRKGWTHVKEGEDGCKPCAPLPDPDSRSGPRTGGPQP